MGVDPKDVGIVAPYRKQTEKIRQLMESLNLDPVKVSGFDSSSADRTYVFSLLRSAALRNSRAKSVP